MKTLGPLCRCLLPIIVCVAAVASPSLASAQPSAADRETARSLVIDGRAKLSNGDASGAATAFEAAHAIMRVPTTGLDLAKARVALGKLIEARDVALEVSRMPPIPNEAPAFPKARQAALELAETLTPRIGALVVTIQGPSDRDAIRVTVDGAPIVASALGLPRKVNPGPHEITASAPGFEPGSSKVEVAEGQSLPVEIALSALVASAPAAPRSKTEAEPEPRVWPWVTGGAGIAALATGVTFLVDFALVQEKIATDCPGGVCDPAKYEASGVESLAAHRDRSGVLGISFTAASGVLLGASVIGLLIPTETTPTADRNVRLIWTGTGVAVAGSF